MGTEERRVALILEILRRFPAKAESGFNASVAVEALDDCAIVPFTSDFDLIIGSDFVRGEGFQLFRLGLLSHMDIGYYLVGANTSDLAAMGASPVGLTVVFRYTDEMTDEQFRDVMVGVATACGDFSIPLLGGDSGSYETSVLAATAFGVCPKGRALLRSKGRPGDVLCLSGDVGVAGAAYKYFGASDDHKILSKADAEELLQRWKRVKPAVIQGRLLLSEDLSQCAMDTSDGLKTACRQLALRSRVKVVIDEAAIPILPVVKRVADALGIDSVGLACGDSVDFRLLFTVAKSDLARVESVFRANDLALHRIGELLESQERPEALLRSNGALIEIPGIEKD